MRVKTTNSRLPVMLTLEKHWVIFHRNAFAKEYIKQVCFPADKRYVHQNR